MSEGKPPIKFLVVCTLRLGDVLLTTPVARAIKRAHPHAVIDMLVLQGMEGVLEGNPDLRQVITVPHRATFWSRLKELWQLWKQYDIALTTVSSDRARMYCFLGSKCSVGSYNPHSFWLSVGLLSRKIPFDDTGTHTLLMGLKLLDLIQVPRVYTVIPPTAGGGLPAALPTRDFAVLHPYPKFHYKRWTLSGWIYLAQLLQNQGLTVVLTGGSTREEVDYDQQIADASQAINLAGQLRLAQTADLIAKARIFVGPDTGITHLAAALGIPAIALFGPTNPVKWGPWPKDYTRDINPWAMKGSARCGNVQLIQGEGDCVPCHQEGCFRHLESRSKCLEGIDPERVGQYMLDMLAEKPTGKASWEVQLAPVTRKFRIAVIVPKYGLVGGGEGFAREVTERLACVPDFDIHVLASQWIQSSPRITFHKIPTIAFPRFLGPLGFAWAAQKKIKALGFDLVHSHHWVFHADVFSSHGIPHAGWIRQVRNRSIPSLYDLAFSSVEHRALSRGRDSYFLPVSSIAMSAFQNEYAELPGHWNILHPGVNYARFSQPDRMECRIAVRKQYGLEQNDFLILFVGMNFEVKGLESIIWSLSKAQSLLPSRRFKLLVVGRGNKAKFARIAKSAGVEEAVTFAGTQQEGLECIYRAADVFTLFSTFDTFGMVVLEAMAAGLPVIVSPNVGAKDLIAHGINGYILMRPDSVDMAAQHLVSLSDPVLHEKMSRAAQIEAHEHSWEAMSMKMETLYRQIISKSSRL